jgi:putative endonuclease
MSEMLSMKPNDTTDGARAETLAAAFLERSGLAVLERNFRVRGGEIDLVCREGKTLVSLAAQAPASRQASGADCCWPRSIT